MPVASAWFARTVICLGTILLVAIPAMLHRGEAGGRVVKHRKGRLETGLLTLASLGFLPAHSWAATGFPAFADYPLRPIPLGAGIICLAVGLCLHYRAHADLGRSWSISLEIREKHRPVTHGLYRRIRHPMYLALLLYSGGQALALPNRVAGPS